MFTLKFNLLFASYKDNTLKLNKDICLIGKIYAQSKVFYQISYKLLGILLTLNPPKFIID